MRVVLAHDSSQIVESIISWEEGEGECVCLCVCVTVKVKEVDGDKENGGRKESVCREE